MVCDPFIPKLSKDSDEIFWDPSDHLTLSLLTTFSRHKANNLKHQREKVCSTLWDSHWGSVLQSHLCALISKIAIVSKSLGGFSPSQCVYVYMSLALGLPYGLHSPSHSWIYSIIPIFNKFIIGKLFANLPWKLISMIINSFWIGSLSQQKLRRSAPNL